MDGKEIGINGWKIVRTIGKGGFGSVYEVEKDDGIGGVIRSALKVISIPEPGADITAYRDDGYDDASLTELFKSQVEDITSEFRLMNKLKGCSNIVSFEDYSIIQHNNEPGYDIYIRMELLTPLPRAFEQELSKTGVIDDTVRRLGVDICRALELCSHYKIIHRDIKPQNIFVNELGDFKLGDFGIAKTSDHTTRATKTGTFGYMAPEVYLSRPYNASVDIYSLGLVMYWMLNERRGPFLPLPPAVPKPSQNAEALDRRMSGEPLPVPKHGSEELKRIVLKACAFDPKDRYANPTEMKRDLERLTIRSDTEAPHTETEQASIPFSADEDEKTFGVFGGKPSKPEVPPTEEDQKTFGIFGTRQPKEPEFIPADSEATVSAKKPAPVKPTEKPIEPKPVKTEPEQKEQSGQAEAKPVETKRRKKKSKLPVILSIAAALVIAAVVLIVVLAGNGKTPSQTAEQPTSAPANPDGGNNEPAGGELAGTYDILVWTGGGAVELTKQQIENFNNTNAYGIKFNATVNPVSEAISVDQMLQDVSAGADIYCFAQDQFARLVQGGALNKLGDKAAATVREANDAGVVAAATSGDTLWAYPMTSDNGYFMYYDKSVIPEADVDSLEKLIADCEAANKYFAFETNTSAWYLASWFFATGCKSEWKTADDGSFESVLDTFDSPEGLIAVKGMKKLVDSPMNLSSSAAAEFASDAAIVVTGTWAYNDIKALLGDNMGVTDLPSFEVDGTEYHLGSFNGCKLMGVKPQDDAVRAAVLHRLAQFLTDETRQMERFEALAWGPSNLNAQKSEAVQNNPGLAALIKQNEYSIPQGQIHGSWWDIAKVIADDVKAATDEAGLQQALTNYYDKISALFTMTEEEKNAWGVIGAICGTMWDTDFPMTEVEAGVFETEPMELHAGEEFKVRQGGSWYVNYGAHGPDSDNCMVDTDGTYRIRFEEATGLITLVRVN